MLGDGIRQTTSTTGTGNLTLTSVAGYPTFANVFPLNFPVSYGLVDSNGLLIEEGIGKLADASTLVRSIVTATYSGGSYVGGPVATGTPSAVSLTGTTTVICTPHAATLESMTPSVDSVSSGVGRYLTSAARNGNTTSVNAVALRATYMAFLLKSASPITSLAIAVQTAGAAGTVARCGIYACTEKGYPGALLATTGDLDTSTTGVKSGAIGPLLLPPGWYFVASVFSGSPSMLAHTASAAGWLGCNPLGWTTGTGASPIDFRYETLASAVLLSTPSATTSSSAGSNHFPIVFVGVQ